MEIILLEDVKKVGKKGETVSVKDGYGRYLISNKQASEVNARTLNDLKLQKKHEEKLALERLEAAKSLKTQLENISVKVSVKMGKDGKLFGSVSSKEIADACKTQHNIEVDKKKIVLPDAIKEVGDFSVNVKLHPEVTGVIKVNVSAE